MMLVVANTVAGIQNAFIKPFNWQRKEPMTQRLAIKETIVKGMQNSPSPMSAKARFPSSAYVLDRGREHLHITSNTIPLPSKHAIKMTINTVASMASNVSFASLGMFAHIRCRSEGHPLINQLQAKANHAINYDSGNDQLR